MANEVTSAAVITHSGVIMNLLSGYGLPKMKPIDFACNQGEGFTITIEVACYPEIEVKVYKDPYLKS